MPKRGKKSWHVHEMKERKNERRSDDDGLLEVGWGQHWALARQTDNGVRALAAGFLGCKATMIDGPLQR